MHRDNDEDDNKGTKVGGDDGEVMVAASTSPGIVIHLLHARLLPRCDRQPRAAQVGLANDAMQWTMTERYPGGPSIRSSLMSLTAIKFSCFILSVHVRDC